MWLSEKLLCSLARRFSKGELAHSSEMKDALNSREHYNSYRLSLLQKILAAADQYGVRISGRDVLDLGCSDGAISVGYLREGASHVYGVDIDEDAIQSACREFGSPRTTFKVCSTTGLPLNDESVDVIVCYDVFEHVSHPADVLDECFRVLRPGGQMLIGTWGWYHPFAPHLWSAMPVPWAHVLVSERTLLRACRRVYHSDWYHPNMHDLDEYGKKLPGKYTEESINPEYLNKYLIRDFERTFENSPFEWKLHAQPFSSKYARWTKPLLKVPFVREFVTAYFWAVLTRPQSVTRPHAPTPEAPTTLEPAA